MVEMGRLTHFYLTLASSRIGNYSSMASTSATNRC